MTKDAPAKYLALSLILLPNAAFSRAVRYEWSPVANADYYQGTLTLGQQTATFRTPSTWILVPDGSVLEVKPFTQEGGVLPNSVITPKLKTDVHQESAPPPTPKVVPPPAQKVAKKPPKVVRKVERKMRQGESSGSTKLRSHLGLHVGLGRDRLTSHGGVYGYSGQSNIAPFGISGLWAFPPSHEWGISADLSYHSFVVSNEVEAIAGEGNVHQKERFTRLTGWLGGTVRALRKVDEAGGHTLDLSLGLSYVQLPTLKVTDAASGQAALTGTQSTRFGLQGAYEWTATPLLSFGLKVRYAPFAVESSHPSTGYGVQLSSGYRVARGQVLDFGVTSSADGIASESSCNGGVDCPAKNTSTSRVTDLRVGYRLAF